MSDYNPGQGWRPADQQDDVRDCIAYWDAETRTWSRWVREAPVPPLPTAAYTVIRAWWGTELYTVLTLSDEGEWKSPLKSVYDAEDLAQMVRFEVLSEPRAITAKAVLDRVLDTTGLGSDYDVIAREFGVQS